MSVHRASKWLANPKSFLSILRKSRRLFRNWPVVLIFNKYVIRRPPVYVLRNGLRHASVGFSDWGPLLGVWVDRMYTPDGFEIHSDDVVIDVGAHSGAFSLFAAKRAVNGIVYAVEPHPRTYEVLNRNIRDNGVGNVCPIHSAVSDVTGSGDLFVSNNELAHSFIQELAEGYRGESVRVDTITIEEMAKRYGFTRIGFLKLNCEGSEYAILQSAPDRVLRMIDRIAVQYHHTDSENGCPALREHLESCGFSVLIPEGGLHRILYASKKGVDERISAESQ